VNTKNFFSGAICVAMLIVALTAAAQLYKWTDANGKVHYTDSMPPEATDNARKEISPDGTVRKSVDRALTADERRQAAIKAEADAKERVARDERERKDKALLATYSNLTDFDRVRDRALAVIDGEITAFGRQLVGLNARRAELAKQVEALGKRPVPPKVATDVKDVDAEIVSSRDLETKRQTYRVDSEKNFARERLQLIDLMAAQAAANANSPNATNPPNTASNAPVVTKAKAK
jgi:hypothetical protein